MFCPKCGAQCPDGSAFCGNCGEVFTAQSQPINQGQPMQYGAPPAYGQPYGQPYGAPRVRTPLDPKKKQAIIVASVCAAILAVFLIILFAVIIPGGGVKSKLRHKWNVIEGGSKSNYLDLVNNTISTDYDSISNITNWDYSGGFLTINYTSSSSLTHVEMNTARFVCAFSPDEKVLYLFSASSGDINVADVSLHRATAVLTRAD